MPSTKSIGARGIQLPTMTAAAWWGLGMATQVGVTARDLVRVQTVPGERKADYMARNFVPSIITPCIMEVAFRTVESFYTLPLMAKVLDLHQLGYKALPEAVRRRAAGNRVNPQSVSVIPRVLKEMDIRNPHLTTEEKADLLRLIEHLEKKLNPGDYLKTLVKKGRLTKQDAAQVLEHSRKIIDELNVEELFKKGQTACDQRALKNRIARLGDELWQHHPSKEKLMEYVREGVESKYTREMLKRIQKTGIWPKMALSTILSFFYYGLLVTNLDVDVVRPWQEKLVARRGTAQEIVKPCYLATIPFIGVLAAGMWDKTARFFLPRAVRNSYLGRFVAVSGLAVASYFATAGLLIKKALSGPPPKVGALRKQVPVNQQRLGYSMPSPAPRPYMSPARQTIGALQPVPGLVPPPPSPVTLPPQGLSFEGVAPAAALPIQHTTPPVLPSFNAPVSSVSNPFPALAGFSRTPQSLQSGL
jgi:hypothetical protein